jgi:hypothetical protein
MGRFASAICPFGRVCIIKYIVRDKNNALCDFRFSVLQYCQCEKLLPAEKTLPSYPSSVSYVFNLRLRGAREIAGSASDCN